MGFFSGWRESNSNIVAQLFSGLFLGFSLISLVELIYFICIRPYCISRKQQKHLVKPIKKMPKISDPYTDDVDYIPTVYLE